MLEKTDIKTTVYSHGPWLVYIVEFPPRDETENLGYGNIEAWLTHADYGSMTYMFGVMLHPVYMTHEMFLKSVEENLPDEIEYYKRKYME